jgi:hypothetical protein
VTLATPVEAPDLNTTRRQIAYCFKLLLDKFAKTADEHALSACWVDRLMSPTELRAVIGSEATPDKARERQKSILEPRPLPCFVPGG